MGYQCTHALLMAKFPAKDAQAAAQSDALDKLRAALETWKKLGNNAGCAEATLVQGQIFAASVFVLLYLVQEHKY